MASVLMISHNGYCSGLALRLAQEGNVSRVYLEEDANILKGFKNPQTLRAAKMLEQYNLIIFEGTGHGTLAKQLSKEYFCIGGGLINSSYSVDYKYTRDVLKHLSKAELSKGGTFTRKEDALNFLQGTSYTCMLKPLEGAGINGFVLDSKSISNEPITTILENDKVLPCILQEVPNGIEVTIEGWFNGAEFQLYIYSITYDRFAEGDIGTYNSCMGSIVWGSVQTSHLAEHVLHPFVDYLKEAQYVGPISFKVICNEKQCYIKDTNLGLLYDQIYATLELVRGNTFDFFWRCTQKQKVFISNQYAISVKLMIDPWLYPSSKGLKLIDTSEPVMRHLALVAVNQNHDGFECSGTSPHLCSVTARGATIQEVRRRAYRTLNNITTTSNTFYRKDIGAQAEKRIEALKTWGWLNA